MRDTADFDAFYLDARQRLLHQTYALTGDLPLAQASVRDAFIGAWHHWRKVSRLEDPERWVRPLAWAHASRRNRAKLWHRQRATDPGAAATLEALAKLTLSQRKILLLSQLTTGSLEELAREAELPLATAETQLQSATALFASHRDVDSSLIRTVLDPLVDQVYGVAWPRPAVIRRAGGARRRTHALAGAATMAAVLVVSGVAVTQADGVRPRLTKEQVVAAPRPVAASPAPEPLVLSADELLTARQAARMAPQRRWSVDATEENVTDEGPVVPCQLARYADPRAVGGLVRTFVSEARSGDGAGSAATNDQAGPSASAVQSTELSATDQRARRSYRTTLAWYAGCAVDRVQLLDTRTVEGVGDSATLLVLRSWSGTGSSMIVGVARTGQVVTTTFTEIAPAGDERPARERAASLLAAAVNNLCGSVGTGTCAAPPRAVEVPPLPIRPAPGLLAVIDLPPVTGVADPWVGTRARRAKVNAAATRCDRAAFTGAGMSRPLTRTFLIPEADLPDTFGLTQTVGALPVRRARAFAEQIRQRMAGCEEDNLGSEVFRLAATDGSRARAELDAWRITVEVSDKQTVTYLMGVIRRGGAVAQVGFTPTAKAQLAQGDFVALLERARDRLAYHPSG